MKPMVLQKSIDVVTASSESSASINIETNCNIIPVFGTSFDVQLS